MLKLRLAPLLGSTGHRRKARGPPPSPEASKVPLPQFCGLDPCSNRSYSPLRPGRRLKPYPANTTCSRYITTERGRLQTWCQANPSRHWPVPSDRARVNRAFCSAIGALTDEDLGGRGATPDPVVGVRRGRIGSAKRSRANRTSWHGEPGRSVNKLGVRSTASTLWPMSSGATGTR
jgi:hypothetical protein